MKKHSWSFASWVLFFSTVILYTTSCRKVNEATELGGGLIPAVDNVTTFDTTLSVEAFTNALITDTTRVLRSDEQFLGSIANDPLFGKTTATMFFELKPPSFKYAFAAAKDSMYIDSVVLVLSYRETYGDSLTPQRINVYEMDQSNVFRSDSAYRIGSNNFTYSNLLGSATVTPNKLDDSLFLFQERAANQLRVRLNDAFGQTLLQKDSTNAYLSDSSFRAFFKGFAVAPDAGFTGNGVMGFALTDTNTKLAIYYKFDKGGVRDTTVAYFRFTASSAVANYVQRDYAGAQVASHLGSTAPDELIYIQNTPGTSATIKIPGLSNLSNRIVYRAELIVQQVADPSDRLFAPPQVLFLDAFDSVKQAFRTLPYDFSFGTTGQPNYEAFGTLGKQSFDAAGNPIRVWTFNVSTYIQNVVNGSEANYALRLVAPLEVRELFKTRTSTDVSQLIPVNPTTTKGRVRLGGGSHPTQPMKLRIVYSRL